MSSVDSIVYFWCVVHGCITYSFGLNIYCNSTTPCTWQVSVAAVNFIVCVHVIFCYFAQRVCTGRNAQVQLVWGQCSEGEDSEALSSSSTLCYSCRSSWFPSLAGPPQCGPVGKSGLQLVFLFSFFLCQSSVHSSWCGGCSLFLQHTVGRTSCMIWDKPDIFILHEMLLLLFVVTFAVAGGSSPCCISKPGHFPCAKYMLT